MIGSLGCPELIIIGAVGLIFPGAIFALGFFLGRRSVLRNAGVPPAGPAASSPPTHV